MDIRLWILKQNFFPQIGNLLESIAGTISHSFRSYLKQSVSIEPLYKVDSENIFYTYDLSKYFSVSCQKC